MKAMACVHHALKAASAAQGRRRLASDIGDAFGSSSKVQRFRVEIGRELRVDRPVSLSPGNR